MRKQNAGPWRVSQFIDNPDELLIQPGLVRTRQSVVHISRIDAQKLPVLVEQPEVTRLLAKLGQHFFEIGMTAAIHLVIAIQRE